MSYLNIAVIIFLISRLIVSSQLARILVISPAPFYTHQSFYYPLWQNLSERGHKLTIFTTYPMNNASLVNITEIDLGFLNNVYNFKEMFINPNRSFSAVFYSFWRFNYELPNKLFEHHAVRKLIKNQSEHFDLVMAENSAWVAFAFAKKFNCPIIPISSQACESRSYKSIGNPEAFFYTSITTNETLTTLERVKHTVLYAIGLSFFYVSRLGTMEVIKKQFGPEYRDAEKIFEKTSVVFENTNNIMHQIRSLLPGVVQLGGLNLYNAHPKIPKDLQQVLDNATNGFIYVSLGTVVNGNEISAQLFLETFNELSYTVLWKTDNETLSNVSSHVYTSKWFPQFNILRHKNIKAFITQGGALSMDEGIHNEVPMIGIPVFLDQFTNVAKMVKLGICIKIQREFLHKHLLKSTILEIAQNSSYKRNIVNLNKLIMDQPQTPLDKAVFWTEYVIRHKGAGHLKGPMLNIPFYQYYLLDVIAVFFCVLLLLIYILLQVLIVLKHACNSANKVKMF